MGNVKPFQLTKASEIAAHVADLLSDPDRFTKGHAARDKHGDPTNPRSSAAVSWCVEGAVHHASTARAVRQRQTVYEVLQAELGTSFPLHKFNDGFPRARTRIVAAAKRAAKKLAAEGL